MSVVKKKSVRWTPEQRDLITRETFKVLDQWNELPLNPYSRLQSAWLQAQKNLLQLDQQRSSFSPKETADLKHKIAQLFSEKCNKMVEDDRLRKLAEETINKAELPTSASSSILDKIKRK